MKLAIGMPVVDSVPGEAFQHHIGTFVEAEKQFPGIMSIIPFAVVPHDLARIKIMQVAIERGYDRLLFMDDDTITPRGGVAELMRIMGEKLCAAVSGFYCRRGAPYTSTWSVQKPEGWFNVDCDSGIHEIDSAGLGCCLVDLSFVKEKLIQPWFKMDQNDTHTIISDDAVFFRQIKQAGGIIFGAGDVQCPHIGRREFIIRETAGDLRRCAEGAANFVGMRTLSTQQDVSKPIGV